MLVVLVTTALVAVVVAFFGYLAFCAFIVSRTGDSSSLQDVAVAMRAFSTLPAALRRPGRK